MKIALIVRRLNVRGGTQRQALELALKLKSLGHEPVFYTLNFSPEKTFEEFKNFKIVEAPKVQPVSRLFKYFSYFASLYEDNKRAKGLAGLIDQDTEVLNPHDQVSYRVAYFYKKQVNNIQSVWMMNDLPTKLFSYMREVANNEEFKISILKRAAYFLVDSYDIRKYIRAQDKIVVLDNRDKNWVREFFGKEAVVVRSGIDLGLFKFVQRDNVTLPLKILTTGILLPHRRFEDLIQALDILKESGIDARLKIIGETSSNPQYFEMLSVKVRELGLENKVEFMGKVSDKELQDAYRDAHVFVFPCHLQSWGLAVFEALATGLPVVVSNTAGASEILKDGESALTVEAKNPKAIADALKRLVSEPELYKKLSLNGRNFVEKSLSWENYAREMLHIFESAK